MYKEFFGGKLKEEREKAELTLVEAGIAAKIDHTKLSRIENGKRNATIEEIGRLANLYEVSIDSLFGNVTKDKDN